MAQTSLCGRGLGHRVDEGKMQVRGVLNQKSEYVVDYIDKCYFNCDLEAAIVASWNLSRSY